MRDRRAVSGWEVVNQIPTLIKDCFVNNVVKAFKTLQPTVMQINVTSKCNSRCIMCNIWKKKDNFEFDTQQWKDVLLHKLFRNIEYLIISGGEPTLRKDLHEIVKYICLNMPKLKKVLISTNGLSQHTAAHSLPLIIGYCNKNNVQVTITVSLDGIGQVHDKIRNIPNAFKKTLETLDYLRKLQNEKNFRLNVGTTIIAANVDDLDNVIDFCQKNDLPVVFYMGWVSETYYDNIDREKEIVIYNDKKECLINFLKKRIAESSLLNGDAYYYSEVIRMLQGKRRKMPCPFADQGLILDATGDVYYCNNSKRIGNVLLDDAPENIYYRDANLRYRKNVIKTKCKTCESSCLVGIGLRKQVFPFLAFFLKRAFSKSFHPLSKLASELNYKLKSGDFGDN